MSKEIMRTKPSPKKRQKRILEEGYKDTQGNLVALEKLCKEDPQWAANLIRHLKKKIKDLGGYVVHPIKEEQRE